MTVLSLFSFLLGLPAMAEGIHAGIPVEGVPGLGPASFQSAEIGWMAPVEGGFVRVFVGQTEAAAQDWAARMGQGLSLGAPPSLDGFGDEAWGDKTGLLIARDGNVAIQVRHSVPGGEGRAAELALVLLNAIEDSPQTWPEASDPSLSPVRFEAGEATVAWDRFGRTVALTR